MEMYSIFPQEMNFEQVSIPRKKYVRVKQTSESVINEDMMMTLFPEQFDREQHLEKLMSMKFVPWCEEDVRDFQVRVARNVTEMLSRHNTSIKSVDECLMWVFGDNEDYDFSIHQCAALCKQSVSAMRLKYVSILAKTLIELRKEKAPQAKLDFYKRCLNKANSYLCETVSLTTTEASMYIE